MSSGLFGTSQEGVDEMVYQLPPGCPHLLLLSHEHVHALNCGEGEN